MSALGNLLGVVIVDTPSNGSAPLRVQFYGVVTGGTGTYLDVNWSFGDGTLDRPWNAAGLAGAHDTNRSPTAEGYAIRLFPSEPD